MLGKGTQSDALIRTRNYGIDALRIVSMFMVVMLHVLGRGGILKSVGSSGSLRYWIVWFIEIAAYCAVNCYALVSGYVGLYSKYRVSNLAILWCRVAFYTIPATVICKLLLPEQPEKFSVVSSVFPIISGQYWYFTAYAVLFLFIPILNEAVIRLSKNTIRFILVTVVLYASVIQPLTSVARELFEIHSISKTSDLFKFSNGYSGWWLVILYLFGAYIRKYGLFNKIKSHRTGFFLSMYFACITITWLFKMLYEFVLCHTLETIDFDQLFINYCSFTILGSGVSLFLAFEQMKLRPAVVRIVAFLSPLAFSVYLIHMQPIIKKLLLTDKLIPLADLSAWQMVPAIIGIVIGIYLVCSLIDLVRHYLFAKLKLKDRFLDLENKIRTKLSKNTSTAN